MRPNPTHEIRKVWKNQISKGGRETGTNPRQNAAEVMTLLQQVLAALLVALANAAALRDEEKFSPSGRELLRRIRTFSPVLTADRRLDHDLRDLTTAIATGFMVGAPPLRVCPSGPAPSGVPKRLRRGRVSPRS